MVKVWNLKGFWVATKSKDLFPSFLASSPGAKGSIVAWWTDFRTAAILLWDA
jgi:hypothetical protein